MADELWMPKDLVVHRLDVELAMVDVRPVPGSTPTFIPGSFSATASVKIGTDGAGDPIWKRFQTHGISVDQVLTDLWDLARMAQL